LNDSTLDPRRIAREVNTRQAKQEMLRQSTRLCDRMVAGEEKTWFDAVGDELRNRKHHRRPKLITSEPHTLTFYASAPELCLPWEAARHYQVFELDAGTEIVRLGGTTRVTMKSGAMLMLRHRNQQWTLIDAGSARRTSGNRAGFRSTSTHRPRDSGER
jgi:hypothetical protein